MQPRSGWSTKRRRVRFSSSLRLRARAKEKSTRAPTRRLGVASTDALQFTLFDRPREVPDDDDAMVGLVIVDGLQLTKVEKWTSKTRKGAGSPAPLFGSRRFGSRRFGSALDARARIESRWWARIESRCVVRIWCSKFNRLVELTRRRRTARS